MSQRADNGWNFCPSCFHFETDTCDGCEEGQLFESYDGEEEGSATAVARKRLLVRVECPA